MFERLKNIWNYGYVTTVDSLEREIKFLSIFRGGDSWSENIHMVPDKSKCINAKPIYFRKDIKFSTDNFSIYLTPEDNYIKTMTSWILGVSIIFLTAIIFFQVFLVLHLDGGFFTTFFVFVPLLLASLVTFLVPICFIYSENIRNPTFINLEKKESNTKLERD